MLEEWLLQEPRRAASMGEPGTLAHNVGRRNTWDDSMWKAWRRHVEDSLLHDEAVVPQTIGVAALVPEKAPHAEAAAADARGASFFSTACNLVNTCLGSGMLSLPWVLQRCGVGGGLFLMLLVPLLADVTLYFLVTATDSTGLHSLTAITERTVGRAGGLMCASTLLFLSFGVLVSYCVVIKQLTPRVLAVVVPPPLLSEELCLAVVCATCLVPLSSLGTVAQLRFASAFSVVLVAAFVLAVVWAAFRVELGFAPAAEKARVRLHEEWWVYFDGSMLDWFSAVPIVAFSYLCHQNIPFMYAEMERPQHKGAKVAQFLGAARVSLMITTVIYVATAAGGFVAFGEVTQANLLVNLQVGEEEPLPDALVPLLHAAFVGCVAEEPHDGRLTWLSLAAHVHRTMITTFPTLSFGLRVSIHTLCFPITTPTATYRWAEASALVLAVYLFATAADNLCFVFQIVGSTCGALLMFIFPAAVYLCGPAAASVHSTFGLDLGLHSGQPSSVKDEKLSTKAVAYAVLLIGFTVLFGSTAASVIQMVL